jgi:hypothetical protein
MGHAIFVMQYSSCNIRPNKKEKKNRKIKNENIGTQENNTGITCIRPLKQRLLLLTSESSPVALDLYSSGLGEYSVPCSHI